MKWLILRRLCQLGIISLFLLGPLTGIWLIRGSLAGSLALDFLPLTDPLVFLQTLLAGHVPGRQALMGVALVLFFYLLVGGRVFCAWVCPVNIINDSGAWLRKRWGLKSTAASGPFLRYWLLAIVLLLAVLVNKAAWETLNPANVLARSLFFLQTTALWMGAALFLFALLIQGGWCRICPTGALYSLLGYGSLLRFVASNRENCDNCKACYQVCPEPQVLIDPLQTTTISPVILSGQCTNCGRCLDVCPQHVFRLGARFGQGVEK